MYKLSGLINPKLGGEIPIFIKMTPSKTYIDEACKRTCTHGASGSLPGSGKEVT